MLLSFSAVSVMMQKPESPKDNNLKGGYEENAEKRKKLVGL